MNNPHPDSLNTKLLVGTHWQIQAKKAVPPEYHVTINTDIETAGLIKEMQTMLAWGLMIHQALSRSEANGNSRAAAAFSGFVRNCNRTLGKLMGRGFRAEDYGHLSGEDLYQTKRRYAEILGNNLTKLNWAFNGPHQRDLWDRNGVMQNWAAHDCLRLMSSSRTVVEDWSKLLTWERKKYGKEERKDDTQDAYDRVVEGRVITD